MGELQQMGFPEIRCQRALLATGNSSAEDAMNWLFGHMEDAGASVRLGWRARLLIPLGVPDIDDPLPAPTAPGTSASAGEPSDDQIAEITQMGFSAGQARKALRETVRSLSHAS